MLEVLFGPVTLWDFARLPFLGGLPARDPTILGFMQRSLFSGMRVEAMRAPETEVGSSKRRYWNFIHRAKVGWDQEVGFLKRRVACEPQKSMPDFAHCKYP